MMKIIKDGLLLAWKVTMPVAIVFALCNLIIFHFHLDIGKVNDKDFLFNFFGILLGFALTIFAFIMAMIDKLRERLEADHELTQDKASRFRNRVSNIYNEIKDDILFTLISLIIIAGMYIFQKVQVPSFHLIGDYFFNRVIFCKSLKLSLFILNLYAIYDLIVLSFRISDFTSFVKVK